ncbi:uncharacterized protein CELE_Y69H2.9 [Caenorhabditis elegans]|uniref:Uncharacterized protein n=1 Tax=Caenorhabditis elegans TaxID=6239 RepID=Q9U1U1_CAEEL|nr:Uncharacterized protein CELE_Y69H2.9 [Caenorhabditis elegans]CAB63406.1 Uncharacterized protein CELE_Y69H2.9 [Caenorhabditis elegans]|eukprot:NP_507650.1 Uncharacterized protein CELE_Y69H2.9 [Caenorhabditis elegans]
MHLFSLLSILYNIIALADASTPSSTCDVAHLNPNRDRKFIDSQLYFLTSCNCSTQLALASNNLKSYKINSTQWDSYIALSQWNGGEKNEACWKSVDRHFAFHFCGVFGGLEINHAWAMLKDCHESRKQPTCILKFVEMLRDIAESKTTKAFCRRYYHYINNRLTIMNVPLENSEYIMFFDQKQKLLALRVAKFAGEVKPVISLSEMENVLNKSTIACSESKRAVNACVVEFFICYTMFTEANCTEKHENCVSKSMASADCKGTLTSVLWNRIDDISAILFLIAFFVFVGAYVFFSLKKRTEKKRKILQDGSLEI